MATYYGTDKDQVQTKVDDLVYDDGASSVDTIMALVKEGELSWADSEGYRLTIM